MTDRAKRVRIRLYGHHVAYIGHDLYYKFLQTCNVLDYSVWLKKLAKKEFNLDLINIEAIEELRRLVESCYFDDIGDWLREIMRAEIREKQ